VANAVTTAKKLKLKKKAKKSANTTMPTATAEMENLSGVHDVISMSPENVGAYEEDLSGGVPDADASPAMVKCVTQDGGERCVRR
jgi:hypothetical protein